MTDWLIDSTHNSTWRFSLDFLQKSKHLGDPQNSLSSFHSIFLCWFQGEIRSGHVLVRLWWDSPSCCLCGEAYSVSVKVIFHPKGSAHEADAQKSAAYFQQMRSAHPAGIHNSFSACSLVGKHGRTVVHACFGVIEHLLVTWRNRTPYGGPRVICNMFQD